MRTREVLVGKVGVGGKNPIRIQSMTTSNTRDVDATIDQIIRLADHGCEIARVTVQGMKEAASCEAIKSGLVQKGYDIPLVADIHFYPPAAMEVVNFADKVRINPGNFVDRRATFKVLEYDDASYAAEIEKIEEKFTPLVEKCKRLKRSMRIGTNHGSLSDRIMNRYGDTPKGMVESAFEFTRVCRKQGYHDIIFSMKASNPIVMIEAYRLLASEMEMLGWDYPIHLGVTEAGEGEDGRIKSAAGIGALLVDGIGDTIRISLTEDPWEEIDPCKRLIRAVQKRRCEVKGEYKKRKLAIPKPLHRDGSVLLTTPENPELEPKPDLFVDEAFRITDDTEWNVDHNPPFILLAFEKNRIDQTRKFYQWMEENDIEIPVILAFDYPSSPEDVIIEAGLECGVLLCDGLGEGVCLSADNLSDQQLCTLSFNILQAARMRRTKTEFISCPGCGRTLFNLQEVTKQIRDRTGHLPGVSIAVMGCIVNGPGEMADADFGYVGSKSGKIDLYVGKECVERNIDQEEAVDHLIDLIKKHERWVDEAVTV